MSKDFTILCHQLGLFGKFAGNSVVWELLMKLRALENCITIRL